jgi:hypothetical protein
MRTGPPENTRRQRPTPFEPQPSSTHFCPHIRNGPEAVYFECAVRSRTWANIDLTGGAEAI